MFKELAVLAALLTAGADASPAHADTEDRASYVLGGGAQYVPHLPVFPGDNGTQVLITPACVGMGSSTYCVGGAAFGIRPGATDVTVRVYDLVSASTSGTVVLIAPDLGDYELRRFAQAVTVPITGQWDQLWVIPDSPKDRLCQTPCTGTAGVITANWTTP